MQPLKRGIMKNLYINKAETIFEMFWDAGDSYPDHHKYSCIDQYGQRGEGRTRVSWNGIQVFSEGRFLLSRELQLDISEFDILIVRMDLPVSLEFAVYCVIDGVKTRIIYSNEDEYEFEGIICGKRLSNIELEFCNKGAGTAPALLLWLGLANSRKREAMLSENNGYGKDCWEGCFQENFEIKPHLSAYFKEEELEAIRENAYGKYADIFSKLQKDAEKLMGYEIEQYIGKYVDYTSPRFGRKRDIGKDVPCFLEMSTLAFVGLINQDTEMLKMACRYALSASCCTY